MKTDECIENPALWQRDWDVVPNDNLLLPEENDDIDFEFEFGRDVDSFGHRIYRVSIEG